MVVVVHMFDWIFQKWVCYGRGLLGLTVFLFCLIKSNNGIGSWCYKCKRRLPLPKLLTKCPLSCDLFIISDEFSFCLNLKMMTIRKSLSSLSSFQSFTVLQPFYWQLWASVNFEPKVRFNHRRRNNSGVNPKTIISFKKRLN